MAALPAGYRPWYRKPALWVFCTALAGRLLVLSRLSQTAWFLQQMGDMRFYHEWAQRLLAGHLTDGHAFYGLPGYAFVLAGVYGVVGISALGRSAAMGVLQVLLEAITAVIIFKLATIVCENESLERDLPERTGGGRKPLVFGLLAGLAWITFVPAQTFAAILMPTAWVVCAYWLGVWRAAQPGETGVWRPWLPIGIAIGVMSMLVATITFLVPLMVVRMGLSVAASRPWPQRAPRLLLAVVLLVGGMFAGSSPAWIHNYYVAHDPVMLSAHSGLNFWMGNNPEATGYPKIPPGLRSSQEGLLKDSITWVEQQAGHPLPRSEVSKYWSGKASAWISAHPREWAWLLVRKVRNFWNALSYDDLSVIRLLQERGVLLPGLGWGVAALLGLAGAPLLLRHHPAARWVTAAVLLHMLAILPVFVTERYRLAAAPGLLILGAGGLCEMVRAVRARRWRPVAVYVLLLAAAGALVWWPLGDASFYALDHFNIGVKELETAQVLTETTGSPEEMAQGREMARQERVYAGRHLREAYGLAQGDPGVLAALGDLALAEGETAQAEDWYRRTLALNPHFTSALNNLGYIALGQKRWPEAEAWLQTAAAADPASVRSQYLLALVRQGAGDLPGAREALARALALSPQEKKLLLLDRELNPR